ncbi:hypothetical protein X975_17796, partial [Stegodyphus mimosarum]
NYSIVCNLHIYYSQFQQQNPIVIKNHSIFRTKDAHMRPLQNQFDFVYTFTTISRAPWQ